MVTHRRYDHQDPFGENMLEHHRMAHSSSFAYTPIDPCKHRLSNCTLSLLTRSYSLRGC